MLAEDDIQDDSDLMFIDALLMQDTDHPLLRAAGAMRNSRWWTTIPYCTGNRGNVTLKRIGWRKGISFEANAVRGCITCR